MDAGVRTVTLDIDIAARPPAPGRA